MPAILKMITYVVPATYYIDILNGLYLRNLTLAYLWPSFLVLFLMFLFLSTVNMLILKKEGL
jgi:ABC-2 type transport system permease protein